VPRIPRLRRFPLSVAARVRLALPLAFALAAGGCSTINTYIPAIEQFGVYKLDINQGNHLSQDMVDRLKVGQTRTQVRANLGTPLITSAFRDNRWDYVYMFMRQGTIREERRFAVFFVDDKLARWEGDEMPPSAMELNRLAAERSLGRLPSADDKGVLTWFFDLFRDQR
jgi:outer membrane protein assembly factor BamE